MIVSLIVVLLQIVLIGLIAIGVILYSKKIGVQLIIWLKAFLLAYYSEQV